MHERLEVAATLDDLLDRSSVTQTPAIPSHFTLAQAEGFALSHGEDVAHRSHRRGGHHRE